MVWRRNLSLFQSWLSFANLQRRRFAKCELYYAGSPVDVPGVKDRQDVLVWRCWHISKERLHEAISDWGSKRELWEA